MNKYLTDEDLEILAEDIVDNLTKIAGILGATGKGLADLGRSDLGKAVKPAGKVLDTVGNTLKGVDESYAVGLKNSQKRNEGVVKQLISGLGQVATDHPMFFATGSSIGGALALNKLFGKSEQQYTPVYSYASEITPDNLEIMADTLNKEAKGVPSGMNVNMIVGDASAEALDFLAKKQARDRAANIANVSSDVNNADQDRADNQEIIDAAELSKSAQDVNFDIIDQHLATFGKELIDGIDFEKFAYRADTRTGTGTYEKPINTNVALGVGGASVGALVGSLLAKRRINTNLLAKTEGIRETAGKGVQSVYDSLKKEYDVLHATPDDLFSSVTDKRLRSQFVGNVNDIKAKAREAKNLQYKLNRVNIIDPVESAKVKGVIDTAKSSILKEFNAGAAKDKDFPTAARLHVESYIERLFNNEI